MFSELLKSRELITRLVARDVSARYRRTVLGYLWALALPAATVALFSFLITRRILPVGDTPLPYPAYALWGVVLWQLFSGIVVAATRSLSSARPLISKIHFSKESLVFASVGQSVFDFAIKIIMVAIVFIYYGVTLSAGSLMLPLVVLAMILLALGIGFFLAIINLLARDAGNMVGIFASFGMFAAPVLYPPPAALPLSLVNVVNPFSPFLIATHDLLAFGTLQHPELFWPALVLAISLFLAGWRIFRLSINRVASFV